MEQESFKKLKRFTDKSEIFANHIA